MFEAGSFEGVYPNGVKIGGVPGIGLFVQGFAGKPGIGLAVAVQVGHIFLQGEVRNIAQLERWYKNSVEIVPD